MAPIDVSAAMGGPQGSYAYVVSRRLSCAAARSSMAAKDVEAWSVCAAGNLGFAAGQEVLQFSVDGVVDGGRLVVGQ